MVGAPLPQFTSKTSKMDLVHEVITGSTTTSFGRARLLIIMKNDSLGLAMAVTIRAEGDAGWVLKAKIPELEHRACKKLKRLRFDGAREFTTPDVKTLNAQKDIDWKSPPLTARKELVRPSGLTGPARSERGKCRPNPALVTSIGQRPRWRPLMS